MRKKNNNKSLNNKQEQKNSTVDELLKRGKETNHIDLAQKIMKSENK